MHRDSELLSQNTICASNMSERQQLLYVIEKSKEINQPDTRSIPDDQINELIEHMQDEDIRKNPPSASKQELRNKLIEESLKIYKPIKKIAFLERKHAKLAYNEIMVCSCRPPQKILNGEYAGLFTVACGKKCLNRVVSTECNLTLCPTGESCRNRRFQMQEYVQVYPIKTDTRGWGLAAGQFIRKGQFIIEYLGEVFSIDSDLGRSRLEKYKTQPCTYLMSTSHNEVIDPARKGNMARFINHSCDPNCETQKWNVMGEVCVGIFAKKNITEDEELTFDYRLDTHKTQLTRCLCGSKNCRQYLGLIPSDCTSADQWLKKLKAMKCTVCKKNSGKDDNSIILCDKCNRGWHIYCLKVPLKNIPKDSWICDLCKKKSKQENGRSDKAQVFEVTIKVKLERKHFEILKKHLEEIIEMDVKLFWDINSSQDGDIEVLIRGSNAKKAEKYIQELSKKSISANLVEDEVIDIELKIEKIYLKSILNYYKSTNIQANVDYDKNLDLDEIYPINQLTSIYITGRKSEIYSLSNTLLEYADKLVIFTLNLSNSEAKVFEQNFSFFKTLIFPVEVRLSKDKILTESPHPFFFYSREERKLVFIASEQELIEAYRLTNAWISNEFQGETETFYHFILPTRVTNNVKKLKNEVIETVKSYHHTIVPTIKYFDPVLPRKYLTIQITGSWKQILTIKMKLLAELKKFSPSDDFDNFFYYVHSQMYRHIFKNSAKFVHSIEKFLTPKFFPNNDLKKVYILKFWDVYSAEVLIEDSKNENINEFRYKIKNNFMQDTETLLNLMRLCENEAQVNFLLNKQLKISLEEALNKIFLYFESSGKDYEGKGKIEYSDLYLNAVSQRLIDESDLDDSSDIDINKIVDKIIDEVRATKNSKSFSVFPISYSSDIDMNVWEPPNYSKLSLYLNKLNSRKIIFGSDTSNMSQIISSSPISFESKDNADLMIGCSKNSNNFLYVIFPDSENK